jgi:hypothetical protein
VSKADEFKDKIRSRGNKARGELMGPVNVDVNEDVNVNNNVNVDVNNHDNVHTEIPYLNRLANAATPPKKKLDSLINSGVYFEKEVFDILMDLAKKGGRGAKSRIVNDALKEAFKNAGLMK